MTTLSACTVVRNAVRLRYPLEASIRSYYDLCDEVLISYDPETDDGTEDFLTELNSRYPKIRLLPSVWDLSNHSKGSEIAIQSNVAIEQASREWVLYVQADEAMHEEDGAAVRRAIQEDGVNCVLFDRRSFLHSLDREIPAHFTPSLLRLFKRGIGFATGDGMTCSLVQGVAVRPARATPRLFNYGRIGDQEIVHDRCRSRDAFYIPSKEDVEKNLLNETKLSSAPFDPSGHPRAILEHYEASPKMEPEPRGRPSVTLSLLIGPGERGNLASFLWQFRGWPGDIVALDDMTTDGGSQLFEHMLRTVLGLPPSRYRILRAPLGGNFGHARNLLQDAARGEWVLTTAPDEEWDSDLLRALPDLAAHLERQGKAIGGFPRANFVDGVLVNDIPDHSWTHEALLQLGTSTQWPPNNRDIQYRLLKKGERWTGRIHEHPVTVSVQPDRVALIHDRWILHHKTLERQRRQDTFYKSLGQQRGMPRERTEGERSDNLRELTLREVLRSFPLGPLTIVETGTLRDPSPRARLSDGWSTYTLAEILERRNAPGSRVYSIDIDQAKIDVAKRIIPPKLQAWVTWICGDSLDVLRSLECPPIDILYLDSSDDPRHILSEFEIGLSKLKPEGIVVVDDTGPYSAGPDGKGTLLLPKAKEDGWRVERRDNDRCHMAILRKQPAPARTP